MEVRLSGSAEQSEKPIIPTLTIKLPYAGVSHDKKRTDFK